MVKKRDDPVDVIFNSKLYNFRVRTLCPDSESSSSRGFIRQTVILVNCQNPSKSEQQAIEQNKHLYRFDRFFDVQIENRDYIDLRHSQLAEAIKSHPENYLSKIIKIPKELE